MAKKLYQLYCDNCHWKKITDGSDIKELIEIPTSNIQKNIAKLKEEKKVKFFEQIKKIKCPKCGFCTRPKKIKDYQKEIDEINDIKNRKKNE